MLWPLASGLAALAIVATAIVAWRAMDGGGTEVRTTPSVVGCWGFAISNRIRAFDRSSVTAAISWPPTLKVVIPSGSGPRFRARSVGSDLFAAAAISICAPVSVTTAGGVTEASGRPRPGAKRAALRTVIVRPPENTVAPPVGLYAVVMTVVNGVKAEWGEPHAKRAPFFLASAALALVILDVALLLLFPGSGC